MEEEFVPYELALKLKELEFNEVCLTYYNFDGKIERSDDWAFGVDMEHKRDRNQCLAPLYQQAFRWFREKHNLEASIQRMPPEVYGKGKGDIKNYLLYIWAKNLNPRGKQTLHLDTYEEAEVECLVKLIEIAKEQNVK